MAKKRNALRAGIFMMISVALVIFVIIAISGMGRFTQGFKTYVIAFTLQDDIAGLRVGDDVRIGGLKVGDIKDIRILNVTADGAAGTTPVILVRIELPAKYDVYKNAAVGVEKNLTGTATINFQDLGSGSLVASMADYLRGRPDSLSVFTTQLGALSPDLRNTIANLKTSSVKISTDLDKAAKILDVVDDWFGPSTEDFHGTLANLHKATTSLNTRMPGLLDDLHTILHNVNDTIIHANSTVGDIQAAANNTKDLTAGAHDLIVQNRGKFDGIITGLKATSDNLKYASSEVRHNPWRLLYQPKPDEIANLNIYDSMRQFAEGAASLDDAATALRDAANEKNIDPVAFKKLMQQLDDSFAHFQDVQTKLWENVSSK